MAKVEKQKKEAEKRTEGPFRTGRQVYDQLRWDRRFDTAACWIEMQERFSGTKKVPFDGFDPDEVPWHRIERFVYRGEVIWDRPERIDRLAEIAGHEVPVAAPVQIESSEHEEPLWVAWSRRQFRSLGLHPRRCYHFDPVQGRWLPWEGGLLLPEEAPCEEEKTHRHAGDQKDSEVASAPQDASQATEEAGFRVVTWNVLAERYASGRDQAPKRRERLIETLAACEADVIGLQEVEPILVRELLRTPWVRSHYWVSEDDTAQGFGDGIGQLLLMRRPFLLQDLRFSGEKHALIGHFALGGKLSFAACVHLSSDFARMGRFIRALQLQILCRVLAWQSALAADARTQAFDREELLSICTQGWELVQQRGLLFGDLNEDPRDNAWHAFLEIPEELHGVDVTQFPSLWDAFKTAGLVDCWPMLEFERPGETFDPQHNPLASALSATGRRRRLDAVWLADPSAQMMPVQARIFGFPSLLAEDGLLSYGYASDHFALEIDFSVFPEEKAEESLSFFSKKENKVDESEPLSVEKVVEEPVAVGAEPLSSTLLHAEDTTLFVQDQGKDENRAIQKKEAKAQTLAGAPPTYHSALIVMPPPELWEAIQAIRKEYDKSFHRWMPHINLVYGFVDAALFSDAAELIQEELAEMEPFTVTFSRIRSFRHNKSDTIWLEPSVQPARALHRLQARLQALFPTCDEQVRKSEAGYTPHLTLGQARGDARKGLSQLVQTWQQAWQPISFLVDHVALIGRSGELPFRVQERVIFGKKARSSSAPRVEVEEPTKDGNKAEMDVRSAEVPPTELEAKKAATVPESTKGAESLEKKSIAKREASLAKKHSKKGESVETFSEKAEAAYRERLLRLEEAVVKEQARREPILSAVRSLCERVCADAMQAPCSWQVWWPVGSAAFGAQTLHSDADILCIGPSTLHREAFNASVLEKLLALDGIEEAHVIWDARVPLLKVTCAGWSMDLLYARIPEQVDVATVQSILTGICERVEVGEVLDLAHELSLDAWDIASQRSLLGLLDGLFLRGTLARYRCKEGFVDLLRTIKCWSVCEGIAEQAKGYLGGMSWAILAGWLCSHPSAWGETRRFSLLESFLSTFSQSAWMQPIGLTRLDVQTEDDPSAALMPIYTPIIPQRNSARHITSETFVQIRQALQKAMDSLEAIRLGKGSWDAFFGVDGMQ